MPNWLERVIDPKENARSIKKNTIISADRILILAICFWEKGDFPFRMSEKISATNLTNETIHAKNAVATTRANKKPRRSVLSEVK